MAAEQEYTPFRDPSLPVDTRIDWLLSELTRSEKLAMISSSSADAPRLGFRRMAAGGGAAHRGGATPPTAWKRAMIRMTWAGRNRPLPFRSPSA